MSTHKRPPTSQYVSTTTMTPTRYQPSTPHAIRALQQRSGAANRTRSLRTQRVTEKITSLDSARGILRRLAKITAPAAKRRVLTPTIALTTGKENASPENGTRRRSMGEDEDEDDSVIVKRPKLSLDIEEGDSDLPIPPTPSILPDEDMDSDEDQPTLTFKATDFARATQPASERIDRRKSLLNMRGEMEDDERHDEDEDERNHDFTILTERGRRAFSEEATERLSRYSFGSIRMSGFGSELEFRRDSYEKPNLTTLQPEDGYGGFDLDDQPLFLPEETIDIGHDIEQTSPQSSAADTTIHIPGMDETFQLDVPGQPHDAAATSLQASNLELEPEVTNSDEDHAQPENHSENESTSRRQTNLEIAASSSQSKRRKRMKMTRHGSLVPSLPSSLLRHIVNENQTRHGRRKLKLGKDHMKALEQAAEWFFEQVGEDLAAFSEHAGHKKRVDSEDMLLLMRRQRVLRQSGELIDAAEMWLPKKVLDELDLPEEL